MFQSMRRSTDPARQEDFKKLIASVFPEYFPDGEVPKSVRELTGKDDENYRGKYEDLMKQRLRDLEEERDYLREKVDQLTKDIIEIAKK